MTAIFQIIVLLLLATNGYALDVFLDTQILGIPKQPAVKVKTNLPDDTRVWIAVYNEKIDYYVQVKTKVVAGVFESGALPCDGNTMKSGTYTLDVAVEPAQLQPPSVQSVIGSRGEDLNGTLAHKGMLGKRVYYSTEFNIL